jgi:hypothetical protein
MQQRQLHETVKPQAAAFILGDLSQPACHNVFGNCPSP